MECCFLVKNKHILQTLRYVNLLLFLLVQVYSFCSPVNVPDSIASLRSSSLSTSSSMDSIKHNFEIEVEYLFLDYWLHIDYEMHYMIGVLFEVA